VRSTQKHNKNDIHIVCTIFLNW